VITVKPVDPTHSIVAIDVDGVRDHAQVRSDAVTAL
jgi:VCBS repeat-containing protein